ncbi:MAG: 50S ribosomal protein L7Ae [Promethearchaeota archaeon]
MSYVKFKIPDKLKNVIKNTLTKIAETKDSKIRKGMNETTKSLERGLAKLVIIAEDVSPPEIVYHLPLLCEEKGVPYGYVSSKKELGNAVKIGVSAAAVAVENVGIGNESELEKIIKDLESLKK